MHRALQSVLKKILLKLTSQEKVIQCELVHRFISLKGPLSALRQFLAIESPLKMMKNAFYFMLTNVPHHIEPNQLIYIANQLTGFYMMGNIGR